MDNSAPHFERGTNRRKKTAHLMLDYGWNEFIIPSAIMSDQGPHFTGQWWKTMCARLGVKHSYSQVYRTQANGRAEGAGKQIISILRKMHAESEINWVEALPRALMLHHDTPTVNGISPYQMVFGRDRNLAGLPYSEKRECEDARVFMDRQKEIDRVLSDKMNRLHEENSARYNSHRRERRNFTVGQQVWVIKPKQVGGHKISKWWVGPFKIIRRVGRDVFILEVKQGETVEAHSDQIKLFHADEILQGGIPLFHHHTDPKDLPALQVDRIRDHRVTAKGHEFLVHWRGAPNSEDSWEGPGTIVHLYSKEWKSYCEQKGLYRDVQGIPVHQSVLPRLAATGE